MYHIYIYILYKVSYIIPMFQILSARIYLSVTIKNIFFRRNPFVILLDYVKLSPTEKEISGGKINVLMLK